MREKSRAGFSLIELLVVIAIIAILAAILFPIFLTARASGKKAKCQANLKQIASAQMSYAADWGDKYTAALLPTVAGDTNGWSSPMWWTRLKPYVAAKLTNTQNKLEGVFQCSANPGLLGNPPGTPIVKTTDKDPLLLRPYGVNYMYRFAASGAGLDVPPVGTITFPTKTVLITEVWVTISNRGTAVAFPPSTQPVAVNNSLASGGRELILPPPWHSGKATVLWFDGHVSSMKTAVENLPIAEKGGSAPGGDWWKVGVMESTNACVDKWFRLDNKKFP